MVVELFYMDTTIWCKSPYKANFVAAIKEKIPQDYRYWDKDEKVWKVSYTYEDELIGLCETYYSDIAKYGERRYNTAVIQPSPTYQTLYLLPTAPKEVVLAAYRALSKLYHPDISKDSNATEKMKRINTAFDEIMGRR